MKTMSSSHKKHAISQNGFTLIELLVVIGILAVLLAITLIAINPAKQFSQANNTKRESDVNTILNAIDQYSADNKGNLTGLGIADTDKFIQRPASGTAADLCSALVPTYIAALPVDPLTGDGKAITDCSSDYNTGYEVQQVSTDPKAIRITVTAPSAELGEQISVTR